MPCRRFPVDGVPFAARSGFHDKFLNIFARFRHRHHFGGNHHTRIRSGHVTRLADSKFPDNKLRIRRFKIQHLDRIRFELTDISARIFADANRCRLFDNAIAHGNAQVVFIWRERIHLVETFTIGFYQSIRTIHLNPSEFYTFRQIYFPINTSRFLKNVLNRIPVANIFSKDFPKNTFAFIDDFNRHRINIKTVQTNISQRICDIFRKEFFYRIRLNVANKIHSTNAGHHIWCR